MGLKKKKNIFILSCCMASCYILYQLYFFLSLTSEDHDDSLNDLPYWRSEDDKYINEYGVIRGVYFTDMRYYRPDQNNEFKCRKSMENITYERINDDYCDCEDGTDEPSTSACPDGVFYCDTQFPKKHMFSIPSNKVNDGICDCCDGSDEFLHKTGLVLSQNTPQNYRFYIKKCPNLCKV